MSEQDVPSPAQAHRLSAHNNTRQTRASACRLRQIDT